MSFIISFLLQVILHWDFEHNKQTLDGSASWATLVCKETRAAQLFDTT